MAKQGDPPEPSGGHEPTESEDSSSGSPDAGHPEPQDEND